MSSKRVKKKVVICLDKKKNKRFALTVCTWSVSAAGRSPRCPTSRRARPEPPTVPTRRRWRATLSKGFWKKKKTLLFNFAEKKRKKIIHKTTAELTSSWTTDTCCNDAVGCRSAVFYERFPRCRRGTPRAERAARTKVDFVFDASPGPRTLQNADQSRHNNVRDNCVVQKNCVFAVFEFLAP